MKVSVALAAYKGEAFLGAQIESILAQLEPQDELIVSDDKPGGETQRIVRAFCAKDNRVQYIEGAGAGVCANVANALAHCSGDVFFLSDQDDVWLPGKLQTVLNAMAGGAQLVLHNALLTDADLKPSGETFFDQNGLRRGVLPNLLKNSYIGCCMAFTRALRDAALPFPKGLPMHDWWLGLLAETDGRVAVLPEPLLLYRRHENTVTGRGKELLLCRVWWRVVIGWHYFRRMTCAKPKNHV